MFRVLCLGFHVSGFRFRVSYFGFQASCFEFRVSCFGFRFRASGLRFRDDLIRNFVSMILDSRFRDLESAFELLGVGERGDERVV